MGDSTVSGTAPFPDVEFGLDGASVFLAERASPCLRLCATGLWVVYALRAVVRVVRCGRTIGAWLTTERAAAVATPASAPTVGGADAEAGLALTRTST